MSNRTVGTFNPPLFVECTRQTCRRNHSNRFINQTQHKQAQKSHHPHPHSTTPTAQYRMRVIMSTLCSASLPFLVRHVRNYYFRRFASQPSIKFVTCVCACVRVSTHVLHRFRTLLECSPSPCQIDSTRKRIFARPRQTAHNGNGTSSSSTCVMMCVCRTQCRQDRCVESWCDLMSSYRTV